MSNEYTPTTERVRDLWENSLWHGCADRGAMADADWEGERMVEQFNRWLERVKAEAQVAALREVADPFQNVTGSDTPVFSPATADYLHARADRIAREAGIETGESK